MKTFKLNNVEVSAEEIKKLIKENPELLQEKGGKPWKGVFGEIYYYVSEVGCVGNSTENNHRYDNYRYLTGNYFKTKEEAEQYVEYQKAVGRITHAILERNEGWKADWSDISLKKFCLYFCNLENTWEVDYFNGAQYLNIIPDMKSEKIAQSIIKDFKDDLEIIRNWAGR